MALIDAPAVRPFHHGEHLYEREPKPIHFRAEEPWEETVSETKRHLEARTTLYLLLKDAFAGAAVGSDQFVYWDPRDPRKCLSPDAFVKLGASDEAFDTWKVWQRGAPDVAVEIVSASDHRDAEWSDKLARYEACGVAELVRFDAEDTARPIRVWDRIEGDLVERAASDPQLRRCAALAHYWVIVPSAYGPQLRLARDPEGKQLLPTPAEDRVRLAAELAQERAARTQAEHARAVAEHERAQERAARTQAEHERDDALAELARLRAELARSGRS
jgi:hypothetical protein